MKKTTHLRSLIFTIFISLGAFGLFAQQHHLKTDIQNWEATKNAYVNSGDYTTSAVPGLKITPSYMVKPTESIKNENKEEFSKGYIQIRNAQKPKNKEEVLPAEIHFPEYAGVKSFKLDIIASGADRKISLYNGETLLKTFDGIGKTGASYTYDIPAEEQAGVFNFILKGQSDPIYICYIEILKAGAEDSPVITPDPPVLIPVFSHPGGEYKAPISVEISSATEGAIIRYTIDGAEPTEASELYSKPILVSKTTTIKAKAFKEGSEPSAMVEAVYVFSSEFKELTTIAEVRALKNKTKVKYTGEAVVTFVSNDKKYIYIQDATGAILIFDKDAMHFSNCEIGSNFKEIQAETYISNKMLRLRNVEKAEIEGTGELMEPTEIKLEDLKPEHQAQLVKVRNVKLLKEEAVVFQQNKNVKIEGSEVVVRPQYNKLDYIGQSIPDKEQTIIAVVLVNNDEIRLVPRSIKEMIPTGLRRISSFTKLYSSEGQIYFEAKQGEAVEVYSTLGEMVYKASVHSGLNSIRLNGGVYIVKVGHTVEKIIVK